MTKEVAMQILMNAQFFAAGAEKCLEPKPDGHPISETTLPGIVCLSFSAELMLKAIAMAEGSTLWGHDLKKLFDGLSSVSKNYLRAQIPMEPAAFDDSMKTVARTFDDWRYVHEKGKGFAAVGFLRQLVDASRERANDLVYGPKPV